MSEDEEMKSSSSEEEIDDNVNEEEIKKLKSELKENPYLYDKYVSLIQLLSEAGELEDLREVRETFAKYYPLTPELWLAWLADEQRLAASVREKENVSKLFEKAVEDYNSVKLWLEYCQFSLWQLQDSSSGVQNIRNIFEKAVVAAGVKAAEGSLIWELYREFENTLLSLDPQNQDQLKSKVDKLFRRQLAVPLLNMEGTLEEYQEWLQPQEMDANVQRAFKSALELLKPRKTFEHRLQNVDDKEESFKIYQDYIALELKEGNPVRVQNIYERRITDHCLEPDVWTEYADYLEKCLKDYPSSKILLKRAVRNCTWNSRLWIKLLRCCERLECPQPELLQVMEDALQSGLATPQDYRDVWLAYIDYRRRGMKNEEDEKEQDDLRLIFQKALEQLASMAGSDPECKVARYWASMEADRFGSMDRARRIWGEILSGPVNESGQYWVEYINLEKMFGDNKHLKKLLPRAFEKTSDLSILIGELWLQFEREEGTLDSYEEVEETVTTKLKALQTKSEVYDVEISRHVKKRKTFTPENDHATKKRKTFTPETGNKSDRKRKFEAETEVENNGFKKPMSLPTPPKKVKSQDLKPPPGFKGDSVQPPPGFSSSDVKPPPGFKGDDVKPPPGFKGDDVKPLEGQDQGQNTVFLSNLAYTVTEEKIREIMSTSGEVIEVRLVKHGHSGKSKGYAYVHFALPGSVQAALQRDREPIDGRPMFISENDKKFQFKYASEAPEKNKLFVRNLPKSTTKSDIETLFGAHGELKDVRLVTFRNGHSKGIAYVDFVNASEAAKAIVQLDNKEISGCLISVAISNPPPRKETPAASTVPFTRSLGGGDKDGPVGSRGRGRSQLSFVPRSLQKSQNQSPQTSKSEKMSNSDFRSMLLGKK